MFEILKLIVFFATAIYSYRWLIRNDCSKMLILLFFIIYSRIVLSSFHQFTFISVVGPLSINACHSITMTCIAVFFLNYKLFSLKRFFVVKIMIVLMIISAIINHNIEHSITSIIKWVLLLELMVIILYAYLIDGPEKVLNTLTLAFVYPVALQILSILTGYSKMSESDGSVSYVGGFHHEAVFSVLLLTGLVIGLLWLRFLNINFKISGFFLLVFFLFLLIMVNYRTTLISALPIIIMFIYDQYWKGYIMKKIMLSVAFFICLAGMLFINTDALLERFIEIPQVLQNSSELMTAPENYTKDERRYFSGRLYMWSNYISLANEGDLTQKLIGNGMDSWKEYFLKYAHNTFVSFYYELGFLGVFVLLGVFIQMFNLVALLQDRKTKYILTGIATSVIVLNLGTMPLWQIEGVFLYAFIFSSTYYFYLVSRLKPA